MTEGTNRAIDAVMDKLDPARILIVEAIGMLENAIEPLMPGQAPASTVEELSRATEHLKTTVERLRLHATQIELVVLEITDGG